LYMKGADLPRPVGRHDSTHQLTLLAHATRLVRVPRGVGSHTVVRYDAPRLQTHLSRTVPSSLPMDPSPGRLAPPGGAMVKPWTLRSASPDPTPRHGRLGGPSEARLPRAFRGNQNRAGRRHLHRRCRPQLPRASDRPRWPSRPPGTSSSFRAPAPSAGHVLKHASTFFDPEQDFISSSTTYDAFRAAVMRRRALQEDGGADLTIARQTPAAPTPAPNSPASHTEPRVVGWPCWTARRAVPEGLYRGKRPRIFRTTSLTLH